jgi:dienelactone hydrolase
MGKLSRSSRVIAAIAVAAAIGAAWGPVSTHARAASLLQRFQDANASAPSGVEERLLPVDDPGHAPLRARLYSPAMSRGAMVLVPGVHHLGIDEPRLVRFARAIAGSGITVLTVEIRELIDYRIDGASADEIGQAAHALRQQIGAPVGVMGMSFAGGLALLAASDARFARDVAFVVAVGAHDDLARVSRFFATNEIQRPDGTTLHLAAHPYGPLVLVYDRLADFFPPGDLPAAGDALRLWLWEDKDAARARAKELSPPSSAKVEALFTDDLRTIVPELLAEIDTHADTMRAASPHGRLAGLRAPVLLLHGAGDSVIPATETLWLATDVPKGLVRDVVVSQAVVHVELEGEPSIGEKWALVHFMAEVLGAAAAEGN